MANEFENLHVVVTGASGELGGAVVEALLRSGAICHLPARRAIPVDRFGAAVRGRAHVATGVEVTDESALASFYGDLPDLWASVHCAGSFDMKPIEATSRDDLARLFASNLESAFLCSREAVRKLRALGRGGRIVNVAARAGLEPRLGKGMVAYTIAKSAVVALTEALAEEVASDRIHVNAIAPSILNTEANRRAMPGADTSRWLDLGDVARAILFLASPENRVTRGAVVPL